MKIDRALCNDDAHWLERANTAIPGGAQTSTKYIDRLAKDIHPHFAVSAQGGRFIDLAGRSWIDLQMGVGVVVLGHCDPTVTQAVMSQVQRGPSFSVASVLEVEVAEMLLARFNWAQNVRFAKNGADVASAAVRLARFLTQRNALLVSGYHGCHDWSLAIRPDVGGIPTVVRTLSIHIPPNHLDAMIARVKSEPGRFAAVIIDAKYYGSEDGAALHALNEACYRTGTLLILDELVSGFRHHPSGLCGLVGLEPAMVCVGKAIANGFSLAALVGPRHIMKHLPETGFTHTFAGECIGLAAAKATLPQIDERLIADLRSKGSRIKTAVAAGIQGAGLGGLIRCDGHPAICSLVLSTSLPLHSASIYEPLARSMAQHGVFWQGNHLMCRDHAECDLDEVLAAYREAFRTLASA